MANSYTLRFSDPTNTSTVTVLGTSLGSGKNNYDTSLDLVGPGYTNYGLDTAQNFLKLLENFAGPNPPANSIKGQLWYDTSNPARKVLRVHNGDITSNRWPSANGIYQQNADPAITYNTSVQIGDIWVDTTTYQLKVRSGSGWVTVGPQVDSSLNKSGSEIAILESTTDEMIPVILNWANGKVVEIISYNEFTPKIVIDGFSVIRRGSNLTVRIPARYNGIAENAANLYLAPGVSIKAVDVLKNKSTTPQTHTGTFVVESANGLYIKRDSLSKPIRIYNTPAEALIFYANTQSSSMKIGIKDEVNDKAYIKFTSNGLVGVNNSSPSASLDVTGTGKFSGSLQVTSTADDALDVSGGIVSKMLSVNTVTVLTTSTLAGKIAVGSIGGSGVIVEPANHDSYDLGTVSNSFRSIYVSSIYSPSGSIQLYGSVSTATQLEAARFFSISGQLDTITSQGFDGNQNVDLEVQANGSLISDQPTTSVTTATQTLLVVNTATGSPSLEKISKNDFLSDVYAELFQPGMIIPYGTSTSALISSNKFLLCNGASQSITTYPNLFAVIGYSYGGAAGNFNLPDMMNITTATGGKPVYYIIKT